jgi:hypothetical protein
VNQAGRIVWQYGQAGVTGAGFNELNTPVQATFLPSTNILITDQVNERVIEVTLRRQIIWQYGMTGVSGNGFNQLNNPNSAELLERRPDRGREQQPGDRGEPPKGSGVVLQ